MVVGEESNSFY